MKIVFLDSTAIPKHISIPRPSFEHTWTEYDHTSSAETIERAKDADIVITSKVIFDRETLQQLPKLKLIAITATGTNNVDLVAAEEMGIAVCDRLFQYNRARTRNGSDFFFKTQFGRLVTRSNGSKMGGK